MEFKAFMRPDGSAGVRNYLAIIPAGKCANRLAYRIFKETENLSGEIDGVLPLLHTHPCVSLPEDNERALRILAGLGKNPNVAGAIYVGVGCEPLSAESLADQASESGKPIAWVTIKAAGSFDAAVDAGKQIVAKMVRSFAGMERTAVSVEHLTIALKCGGSSAASSISSNPAVGHAMDLVVEGGGTVIFAEVLENVGAEEILARRAANKDVLDTIYECIRRMESRVRQLGVDIRGAEPTQANIEAGLTTLEEKSLGAVMKTGSCPIVGALRYGEAPRQPGLHFMDSPDDTPELFMGMAAAGAQLLVFSVGGGVAAKLQRTPGEVGRFDLVPVIKVIGDPHAYKGMEEYFDINAGTVIEGIEGVRDVGQRIFNEVLGVASGKRTKMELMRCDYREPLSIWCSQGKI